MATKRIKNLSNYLTAAGVTDRDEVRFALDNTQGLVDRTDQMRLSELSKSMGFVNVLDFGAVGDGATNDAAAFTAALATGKPVFVPAGDYAIASTIAIPSDYSGLFGVGPTSKLIWTGAAASTMLDLDNVDFVRLEGFSLWGAASGTTPFNVTGLTTNWCNRYSISNVLIRLCNVAWDATESFIATLDNLWIKYCTTGISSSVGFNDIHGNIKIENVSQAFDITGGNGIGLRLLIEGDPPKTTAATMNGCNAVELSPSYTEIGLATQTVPEFVFGDVTECNGIRMHVSGAFSGVTQPFIALDRVNGFELTGIINKGVHRDYVSLTANSKNVSLRATDESLTDSFVAMPSDECFMPSVNYYPDPLFTRSIPTISSNTNTSSAEETTEVPAWATRSLKVTATAGTTYCHSDSILYFADHPQLAELKGKKIGVGCWIYVPDTGDFVNNSAGPEFRASCDGTGTPDTGTQNTRWLIGKWQFVAWELTVPADATYIRFEYWAWRNSVAAGSNTYCYFAGGVIWRGGYKQSHRVSNGQYSAHPAAYSPQIHRIRYGSGTPNNAVTAPVGTLYLRTDGSTSTTLYVKETGTGNTGWVAK